MSEDRMTEDHIETLKRAVLEQFAKAADEYIQAQLSGSDEEAEQARQALEYAASRVGWGEDDPVAFLDELRQAAGKHEATDSLSQLSPEELEELADLLERRTPLDPHDFRDAVEEEWRRRQSERDDDPDQSDER